MKIAIIGTGISGLGAAWLLNQKHDITVFEKNAYVGGHSRTIDISANGSARPVDTGFIVFNHRNYPLLTGFFKHLGVATQKSDMSFGASVGNGFLEYGSKGMFAQKRNLLRPQFWGMIADILRFNRTAEQYADSDITLGDLLDKMRMGEWFRLYYLQAMGAAIWSCPVETILAFPAATFIRFFKNHGLLTVNDHPQWYTVTGGSREYVRKMTAPFADKIHLNCGATAVARTENHVEITDTRGDKHIFDHAVIACHADEALALLQNPTADEKSVLGAFGYQNNDIVVHRDTSFMPKHRGAWASWIYLSETMQDKRNDLSLTYWMNNLQGLASDVPVLVTLNPHRAPDASMVFDRHTFKHPVFTLEAIRAQSRVADIQNKNRLSFCGAWQRYGFHEDGLMSAVAVCENLGCTAPWR